MKTVQKECKFFIPTGLGGTMLASIGTMYDAFALKPVFYSVKSHRV